MARIVSIISSRGELDTTHLQPGDKIDFTRWRVGSTYRRRQVGVCPKCGKRGVVYPEHTDKEHRRWPSHVDHRLRFEGWAMIVEESCYLPLTQEATDGA